MPTVDRQVRPQVTQISCIECKMPGITHSMPVQKLQARGRLPSRGSRPVSDLREQLGDYLVVQELDGEWQGHVGLIKV
jgi:hypothetical protein